MAEVDDWITPKDEVDDWITPQEAATAIPSQPGSVSVNVSPDRLARKSLAPVVQLPSRRPTEAPQPSAVDDWLAPREPVPFTGQSAPQPSLTIPEPPATPTLSTEPAAEAPVPVPASSARVRVPNALDALMTTAGAALPGLKAGRDLVRGTEFEKGVIGSTIGTNPKLLGDAMEGIGVLTDSDTLQHYGGRLSKHGQSVLDDYKPRVPSFTNIDTGSVGGFVKDVGSYAGYQSGAGIGTSIPSLVMGGIAGAATANPLVGIGVGAFGPSYIQNFGDVYGSSRDDKDIAKLVESGELSKKKLAGVAAVAAIPMAALDILGLETVLGKTLFAEAKHDLMRRLMKGIAIGAITEGSTEGAQEVFSQWAQHYLGSQTTLKEKAIQVLDNVFGGMFAGGPMAGAASLHPGQQPTAPPARSPQEIADAIGGDTTVTINGQVATPATPTASPAGTGLQDWLQETLAQAEQPGNPPAAPVPSRDIPTVIDPQVQPAAPEAAVLRAYGYSDQQINSMTLAQRAGEYKDALEAGVEPEEPPSDLPATSESGSDLNPEGADDWITPGTRQAPITIETGQDVADAAAAINQDHSPAQGEANNIQRGHAKWQGLDVTLEAPADGVRRGLTPDGKPFEQSFANAYGYIKGTKGADGDALDVFFGEHPDTASEVYVLNEKDDNTGRFRQTKSFIGFHTQDDVERAYLGAQGKTRAQIRNIVPLSVDEFKDWVRDGDHKKPIPAPKTINVRPRAKQTGPQSLLQFIAGRGGIDPNDPLIGDVRGIIGKRNLLIPGYGPLIRKGGPRLDNHREAAVEAAFMRDTPFHGGVAKTTVADLLNLMDEDNRGQKQYAEGYENTQIDEKSRRRYEEGEERLGETRDEITAELAKHEIADARPDDLERAARYVLTDGMDPVDAYDRAIVDAIRTEELLTEAQQDTLGIKDDFDALASAEAESRSAGAVDERQDGVAQGEGESDALRGPTGEAGERADTPSEPRPEDQGNEHAAEAAGSAGRAEGLTSPEKVDNESATTEHTPADEQTVLPGAERIGQAEQAQRKADQPLKPKVNQKPADEGLFSDDAAQTDLVDRARKPSEQKIAPTDNKLPDGFKVRARKQTNGSETFSLYQQGKGYVGTYPTETEAVAAAAGSANISSEESTDGLPSAVPPRDARPGAGAVQAIEPSGRAGDAGGAEIEGSGTDVSRPDQKPAEREERPAVAAGDEGSRGAGESDVARLPERDDGRRGRDERAAGNPADLVVGENYTVAPGALDEGRSFKTKALDNIRAIELARQIEAEGRPATRAEQEELARYVGWGGIKGAFPDADGNFAKGFEDIGGKLKELLSDTEYTTARRSIQYAHYTAENVVRAMWSAAERLGFKGGQVFEPGMGVGNFAGMMPPDVAAATHYVGLELDHTTARIAKLLYPKWGVRRDDFTKAPLPENTFDLVIGNPPFADVVIKSDPKYAKQNFFLHDYFFAKALDGVRPGGVLMFISSAGTMNRIDTSAREYLADRADLVGAVRLPGNAFKKNAGTEVTTDIVILRKRLPGEEAGDRTWTETAAVKLPGPKGEQTEGNQSRYFADHPEMVLGEQGFFDKLYEGRYAVRAPENFDLDAALAKAIDTLPRDVMQPWQDTIAHAEVDFGTSEKKEGTFYAGPGGKLMQVTSGVGREIGRRGKGVEGGRTQDQIDRISGLIPVRDALRAVYAADLAEDTANAEKARERLNRDYDAFVNRFGPINKADIQKRRPTSIQEESARSEAREEARYAGLSFDEGSFDPSDLYKNGATLMEVARARKEAREIAQTKGQPWDEGSFDPVDMPDVIIDRRPNVDPFMDDPESYRLRAIERYDDATGRATKSRVFSENVVSKPKAPEIKSINDAVLHVLNQHGRLDIAAVAALVNKTEAEAVEALGEKIYRDPGADHVWVTSDEYLSGNVRKKLTLAKAAAERDPDLRRNVTALEAAQPTPLAPSQIHATLGMPWLPEATVRTFGYEALGLDSLKVRYIPSLAQWIVSGDTDSVAALTTWGTDRRRAPALLKDALNRQSPKIYDTIKTSDGTTTILNVAATQAAQEKIKAIQEKFADWVWADPERTETLAGIYNDNYNNLVARDYDGGYLTTPGISTAWKWRPHQTRVISRIIQSGNTYMAHAVGAGKTSAMIGAGMEMRRLGLVRKPMYAVPNHMLAQFTKEFYEQYPTARIAVADERRFHTDRRKQFIANVASEDLDAIIITHSAMGMIPVSDTFQDGVVKNEIEHYRELLSQIPKDNDNRITRSRIEKQIERLEQRLSGRNNRKRDQVFTFEEMGVDFMFVDEAHGFRKLDFSTQMGSIKGISPEGSGMAWDLYVKSLYLDQINPNRSLVLASGTPVTNTMAELYTVSRYLQRGEMAERGLSQFDAWAGAFGEPATELEQDAAGGYKPVTRFSRFVNVPELSSMVRQVMDVVTSRQLEQYVVRPKIKNGKRAMNLAEKSRALEVYQLALAERMRKIEARKGPPQKGQDIMLSVINDGRHAAIDMRLVHPDMKNDPGSKLSLLVDNTFKIWQDTRRKKFYAPKDGAYASEPADTGPATQMIFANLGLSGKRGFSVPDYIRSELARRGVPKDEIALIANYKTHVAKQKLFNDMNEGKVRVLIGSTAKMGTGVNAQRRLYAIHNLDPLWYPSDDEQRNGRGLRQGNMNPEIEIHDYSTKGTYDSTMWGMMARKARFIQGFFEGDPSLRDMDDLGEASQYEQAKAITTNDPRLIKFTELKQDLERARRRQSSFDQELHALLTRRSDMKNKLAYANERVGQVEQDLAKRTDVSGDKFSGAVGKKTYGKRVEFGDELLAASERVATKDNVGSVIKLAEVGGFPIYAAPRTRMNASGGLFTDVDLTLRRSGNYERTIRSGESAIGVTRSIEAVLSGFEHDLAGYKSDIAAAEKFLADSQESAKATFKGGDEIARLAKEVKVLEAELAAPAVQPVATDPASISSLDELFGLGKTNTEQPIERMSAVASVARVDTLTPKARQRQADLERMVAALVQRLVGNQAQLQFHPGASIPFEGAPAGWGGYAEGKQTKGLYTPAERLIELAIGAHDVTTHAFHEAFHDIEAHLASGRELELMIRETPRLRQIVQRRYGFTDAELQGMAGYEVRAMAFEAYAKERENGGRGDGYTVHIGVRRVFERLMRLLRAIRNGLSRLGFETVEDIFGKAYEGRFADQQSRHHGGPDVEAFETAASVQRGPRVVRPSSGNLPVPQIEMPHESVRAALRDPTLSRPERLSAAFDAFMLTPSRALWDKLIDVARIQRAAELATGDPTAERFDTYLAATLYPGRTGERLKDASHDLFRPIYDAMKENGISREELHDYLYARHAPERNAQIRKIDPDNDAGSGMTDERAAEIMAEVGGSNRQRLFDNVAELVDAVVAHNRDLMEREGLEHAETLLRWSEAYDHYVPLKGAESSEGELQGTPSIGGGFDVRRPESRRAMGRFSRADDILTNLLDQTQRTIIRSEKNRVGKTFLRFAQKNPSPLYRLGLAEQRRQINPQTGLVERVWVTTANDAANVFGVKVAGETYYIKIEHEGLVTALKNLGIERLPSFFRMIAAFTRQYSAFQTARNPEFVLTNFARDLQDAGFSLNAEQQKGFKRAFVKNLLNGRAFLAAVLGEVEKTDNRYGRLYDEWRLAGGKISTFGYKDIETIRRDVERELARRTESLGRKIAAQPLRTINPFSGHVVKLFEAMSDVTESTTRLAIYAAAKDIGLSKAEAARAARSMTVDFSQKGKYGHWFQMAYAFANPAMQGTVNLARRLRKSRKMRVAAASIAVAGFSLAMWNMWAAGDDDDDKKNRYAKKPYWEREKNIIIFMPGGKEPLTIPIKIPLGYALTPFWMMGENAALATMGKITPLEALGNWIGTTAKSFNPLGGEGSAFDLHMWASLFSPTILDPVYELVRNRNWLNRPIHPDEKPWTKGKPHSEQSKITTSPIAMNVAEWINRVSGGNHFQKGNANLYPDDLEYAWNFALGGFGKFMLNGYGMAADKMDGVETPVERIPFVRRFVSPIQSDQGERTQFYEAGHEAGERTAAVRDAVKSERQGNNIEDAQKTIRDYGDKVGYRIGPRGGVSSQADKIFRDANKQVGNLRLEERDLRNDSKMNRAERAEKIKQNRATQIEIMRAARKDYWELQQVPK